MAEKVKVVSKVAMFGSLKVVKWKVIIGDTVVGEVPSKELAISRATNQARSVKQTSFELHDTEAGTIIEITV